MQAPAALPVGSAAQMRTVDAGSRTASVTLRSSPPDDQSPSRAAPKPETIADAPIAGGPPSAIAAPAKREVERPRRPDEGEVDQFHARLDRVGAVERMGDRGVDWDDDRRSRCVAIMDRHVAQGSQTMGGGQKNARAQDQSRAEAGLVAAANQHHRHPVGEAAVRLGADERSRRSERREEGRDERQR